VLDPTLDLAPCGYLSVADDGEVLEVNTTLATMLGYATAALVGSHIRTILPPGGRIFYQTHIFPLLRLHGMVEEIYVPLRTREGSDLPMLMNAARRGEGKAAVNHFIFVRMIQRHEFENQLVEARRLAEEADSAKAKFLSMMSHDLRTPLTAISGNADLTATEAFGPVTAEQREAMAFIKSACNELLRMINDILGFAQLGSGRVHVNVGSVSVSDVVARSASLVRLRLQESGIAFESNVTPADLAVTADADRLQQVLLNLLTNASKFTPPGGRVSVLAEEFEGHVRIHVRDTGIGIEHDHLSKIFDPFVQVGSPEASSHGVGLGLAISRELARAMSGDLAVESTPGRGSVFTIELPAAAAPAPPELSVP
jgi:PAS domain S-box-containing protein